MRLRTAIAIACWIGVSTAAASTPPEASDAKQAPEAAVQYFRTNSPDFPPLARKFSLEGRVIARITIDTSGTASCAVETSSGTLLLDRAMLDWCAAAPKFAPASLNGIPEPFSFKIAYNFKLDGDPPEGLCQDVSGYDQPLPGERGQHIEFLAAIDRARVDAMREELAQLFRNHLDEVAEVFNRSTTPTQWPIANATPQQVHAWLVEHREATTQRFVDSLGRFLGPDSAFSTYRNRQRRCIFDKLSLPELRAAAAFQRTAAGAAVLRTVQHSGERFVDTARAAMRFADVNLKDGVFGEAESTFPGFLAALPAAIAEWEEQ